MAKLRAKATKKGVPPEEAPPRMGGAGPLQEGDATRGYPPRMPPQDGVDAPHTRGYPPCRPKRPQRTKGYHPSRPKMPKWKPQSPKAKRPKCQQLEAPEAKRIPPLDEGYPQDTPFNAQNAKMEAQKLK